MKRQWKSWILVILSLFLMPLSVFAADVESTEIVDRPMFSTPEEAIEHFYAGMAENDLEKMLEASVIDYADRYDYEVAVNQMNAMTATQPLGSPGEYELYREMTEILLKARLVSEFRVQILSLLLEPPYLDMITDFGVLFKLEDETNYETYVELVDPAHLEALRVTQIVPSEEVAEEEVSYDALIDSMRQVYGGDEYVERMIALELFEKEYAAGASLVRFADDWRIVRFFSVIGGTPASGAAIPGDQYEAPQQGGA